MKCEKKITESDLDEKKKGATICFKNRLKRKRVYSERIPNYLKEIKKYDIPLKVYLIIIVMTSAFFSSKKMDL